MKKTGRRVAIFTDAYLEASGGIPAVIRAQAGALRAAGHKVVIFSPGYTTDEEDVVVLPVRKFLKVAGTPIAAHPKKLVDFVLTKYPDFKQEFDVIHVHHELFASIAGVWIARQTGVPVVQTVHGREDSTIEMNVPFGFRFLLATGLNLWHKHFLAHPVKVKRDSELVTSGARAKIWEVMVNQAEAADAVIAPSKHFAEKYQHCGLTKPIVHVSNAIEDEIIEARKWVVRKFKAGEELRLIWNSRLSQEKRILPFLEAVRIATLEGAKLKVDVFGGGNDLKRARRFVAAHGLSDVVTVHGVRPREEILEAMRSEHLSILMSYNFDNQPMTLLEAEATGLPALFCDPDMREVVPAEGSICAAGPSAREVAEAILEVYAHPERIEKMSAVMLKKRTEIYQSVLLKKLLEVYNQVCE